MKENRLVSGVARDERWWEARDRSDCKEVTNGDLCDNGMVLNLDYGGSCPNLQMK